MRAILIGIATASLALSQALLAVDHADLESVWSRPSAPSTPAATGQAALEQWLKSAAPAIGVPAEEVAKLASSLKSNGAFRYAETPQGLFLANEETGLAIGGWNSGQPVIASLYHFPTVTEWLGGVAGPLWELVWKKPQDARWLSTDLAAPKGSIKFESGEAVITMDWPARAIGDGKAGVIAEIRFPANDSIPRFSIKIKNESATAGLWSVRYPILNEVGKKGKVDALVGTLGASRLARKFMGEVDDHLFAEQVRALTMGNSSLYISTEDPKHWQKYFRYKAGGSMDIYVLPDDAAVPGVSYEQPFPTLIGPMSGDWYDVAQRYRKWGLQQSWVKRGTVDTWKGPGREMADKMIWFQTLSPQANDVPKQVDSLISLNGRLGVPAGVHYYQWWAKDAFSPSILTAGFRAGLPEGWDKLRKADMEILPYFNVLYWKSGWRGEKREGEWPNVQYVDPGFAEAKAAACLPFPGVEGDDAADEKFRVHEDHYFVYVGNHVMVPMCRLAPLWLDHLLDLAKLLEKNGNDMLYLDQGGVPPRSPCFNPNHGHKLGGGSQWADGTRKMMEVLKFGTGREMALCCEGAYEGYLDLVENQFMHYWPWLAKKDALCPLFETIYHDYTLFMAAVKPHRDATAYAIDIGTRLLHGNQFRAEARMFDDPKFSDQSAFIDRMARLRKVGSPYLVSGQLVRPPDWKTEPAKVKVEWVVKNNELLQTISFPGMERAAYRLKDGSEALFVVNFTDKPASAQLDLGKWAAGGKLVISSFDGTTTELDADAALPIAARDGIMIRKSK